MKRQNRSSEAKQTSSEVSKSASVLGSCYLLYDLTDHHIPQDLGSRKSQVRVCKIATGVSSAKINGFPRKLKNLDLKVFPLCRQLHTREEFFSDLTVRLSPILQPQQNAITKNLC